MSAISLEPASQLYLTASFAESLAREYARRGGDLSALFSAYVGLVASRDEVIASDCLKAIERMLSADKDVGSAKIAIKNKYQPRILKEDVIKRRQKIFSAAKVVLSKYCCFDGRNWAEVGVHELIPMSRQGKEATALLAACPANLPTDGSNISTVLGVKKIDEIIEKVRNAS